MLRNLLLLLAIATPILTVFHGYPDCQGTPNNQPVIDQEPELVKTVTNGKKYIIKSSQNNTNLPILSLKGSWYEMGYAYGELMKEELNIAIPGMFDYLIDHSDTWYGSLPAVLPKELHWILNLPIGIREKVDMLLDAQAALVQKYTPPRYDDELRGMADASGLTKRRLNLANLFPELVQAHCSMAGIWGPASANGKLIQLRALDWDYKHYIANHPLVVAYFPEEEGSNPFSTFSFTGIIGAVSGYSTKVAVSEKVWSPSSTELKAKQGEPFLYILRDILQFGNDMDSSIKMLFEKPRTCRVHVGVGSRKDNNFQGIQMSYNEMNIFNDKNYTEYTVYHPQIDGVMFFEKHEPARDLCFASVLQENHGKLTAEIVYREAVPLHQTGDTQVAVYDFDKDLVYLAYSDPNVPVKAYVRPLVKLDMKKLLDFNTQFP